jgi:hypothetical protein
LVSHHQPVVWLQALVNQAVELALVHQAVELALAYQPVELSLSHLPKSGRILWQ